MVNPNNARRERWDICLVQWNVLKRKTSGKNPEHGFPIIALLENCCDRETVVIEEVKITDDSVELTLIDEAGFINGSDLSTLPRTKKVLNIKKPFSIKYAKDSQKKTVWFSDL